jgi:type I pantothenate kinase
MSTGSGIPEAAAALADRAAPRLRPHATAVVAVAGPVAVGKSTLAEQMAATLRDRGTSAEVVSTDGFLFPFEVLDARGLVTRKGFPESYDVEALRAFLDAVRETAHREHDVTVPIYSHETYDILPDERRAVPPTDVVVLEGLNALYATTGLVDLGVYVDAPLPVIETWYVERFVRLVAVATPGSFYTRFSGLDHDALVDAALAVYRSINLPNLTEHIGPSRDLADVVVEKRPDHAVGTIRDREGR